MKLRILSLLLPLSAFAAIPNQQGGVWTGVTVMGLTACTAERCPPKGWLVVELSANATGAPPACAHDNPRSIAVSLSENAGGGMAAAILERAQMMGEQLTVIGTGTCSVDAAMESLAKVTATSAAVRTRG
jgi:hypothetical protein